MLRDSYNLNMSEKGDKVERLIVPINNRRPLRNDKMRNMVSNMTC